MDVVPRNRRLVVVSQHATQLESLSAPGGAVQFDLRSDRERFVRSRGATGRIGEDVESVDTKSGQLQALRRWSAKLKQRSRFVLGRRPLQAFLVLDQLNGGDFHTTGVCDEGCRNASCSGRGQRVLVRSCGRFHCPLLLLSDGATTRRRITSLATMPRTLPSGLRNGVIYQFE